MSDYKNNIGHHGTMFKWWTKKFYLSCKIGGKFLYENISYIVDAIKQLNNYKRSNNRTRQSFFFKKFDIVFNNP